MMFFFPSAVIFRLLLYSQLSQKVTCGLVYGRARFSNATDSATTTHQTADGGSSSTSSSTLAQLASSLSSTLSPNGVSSSLQNDTTNASVCQASSVSWSEWHASAVPTSYITNKYDVAFPTESAYTFGTADVYTTIDGIARAHGTLTPTATSEFTGSYVIHTVNSTFTELPLPTGFVSHPRPTCVIPRTACSSMYLSYRSSLGISLNVSIPQITPVPTNSPRCNELTAFESASDPNQCVGTVADGHCSIYANNVKLMYWAPQTAPIANASAPVTMVTTFGNATMTMTSPSVYMEFDTVSAITSTFGEEICGSVVLGDAGIGTVGSTYTSRVISVNPTDLSSLIRDLGPGVDVTSAVDQVARGGPDYDTWAVSIWRAKGTKALSIDYENLASPSPVAYYLNPPKIAVTDSTSYNDMPPGCSIIGPHVACNTMFNGWYKPMLSVPAAIRELDSLWAPCEMGLYGVYDPPIALQQQQSAAGPEVTRTGIHTPTSTAAEPTSTAGAPTVTPTVTPSNSVGSSSATAESVELPTDTVVDSSTERSFSSTEAASDGGTIIVTSPTDSPTTSESSNTDGSDNSEPTTASTQEPTPGSSIENEPSSVETSSEGFSTADPATPNTSFESDTSSTLPGGDSNPTTALASDSTSVPATSGATSITEATSDSASIVASLSGPTADPVEPTSSLLISPVESLTTPSSTQQPSAASGSGSDVEFTLSAVVTIDLTGSAKDPSPSTPSDGSNSARPLTTSDPSATSASEPASAHTASDATVVDGTTIVPLGPGSSLIDPSGISINTANPATPPVSIGQSAARLDSKSNIVFGSKTLVAGGSAMTVGGTTLSLAASASAIVIDGSTSLLPKLSSGTTLPSIIDTPGGHDSAVVTTSPIVVEVSRLPSGNGVKIGGSTLSIGGPAMTTAGQAISLGPNGIVIQSSVSVVQKTVDLATAKEAVVAAGSTTLTVSQVAGSPDAVIVGQKTLSAGGQGLTVGNEVLTMTDGGLVARPVDTTTQSTMVLPSSAASVITAGSVTLAASSVSDSSNVVMVGSETISVGGSALTTSGQVVTAVPGGVEVIPVTSDGSTVVFSSNQQGVITAGSTTLTASLVPGSNVTVQIGSTRLSQGGPALTIGGETISYGQGGIVVESSAGAGTRTVSLPVTPSSPTELSSTTVQGGSLPSVVTSSGTTDGSAAATSLLPTDLPNEGLRILLRMDMVIAAAVILCVNFGLPS